MKKTLILALLAVFALTGMAFAENRVEVKVTSEPIQFHALCDKAGGFTLEFDSESTLVAGDQITIDVDFGVTLCRTIDLEISPAGGGTRWVTGNIPATSSPVIDGGPNGATSTGAGVYFRLFGLTGTQRITLSVLGEVGIDSLVVGTDVNDTLTIAFLDQRTNDDFAQNGLWVDLTDDNVDNYVTEAEVEDNTLCINVSQYDENTVDGNMDSAGDKFTFIPSDPQIAHVVVAVNYNVVACEKVSPGNIEIGEIGGQGGSDTCFPFDWETQTNYCVDTGVDNMFIVETTSPGTFYDVGEFQFEMTILTDGIYWTNGPVTAESYISAQNACLDRNADAVTFASVDYFDADMNPANTAPIDGTCVFDQDAVTLITSCVNNLVTTGNRRAMSVNIPPLAYDLDEITLGDEVIVEISLIKCPCGSVWTQQVSLGILGCPDPAAPTNTLLYPYGTSMAGDAWWDGFVVTNISSTAGTATLYFWESDGDQGQMVVSVPANGMFVSTFSSMITAPVGGQVVQAMTQIGGSGVLGDAQLYVVACTDFNPDGFLFMGNGVATPRGEAMGYLPRDDKSGLCPQAE